MKTGMHAHAMGQSSQQPSQNSDSQNSSKGSSNPESSRSESSSSQRSSNWSSVQSSESSISTFPYRYGYFSTRRNDTLLPAISSPSLRQENTSPLWHLMCSLAKASARTLSLRPSSLMRGLKIRTHSSERMSITSSEYCTFSCPGSTASAVLLYFVDILSLTYPSLEGDGSAL